MYLFSLLCLIAYSRASPQVLGGGGQDCFVKEFQGNITIEAGKLLRLSCPTNCPEVWEFSSTFDGERTEALSDFDNPPYFYIMGVTASNSGWYWCLVQQGSNGAEASVFVEVITNDIDEEIVTETTVVVQEITEVAINLEEAIKHVEETTIAAAEELFTTITSTEASLPSSSDLVKMVAKHLQPIHRQLADISGRLDYIEEKLKIKQ